MNLLSEISMLQGIYKWLVCFYLLATLVTPPEYEPPGFKAGVNESLWFEGSAVHFRVGELQSRFHTMKLRVTAAQSRLGKLQEGGQLSENDTEMETPSLSQIRAAETVQNRWILMKDVILNKFWYVFTWLDSDSFETFLLWQVTRNCDQDLPSEDGKYLKQRFFLFFSEGLVCFGKCLLNVLTFCRISCTV